MQGELSKAGGLSDFYRIEAIEDRFLEIQLQGAWNSSAQLPGRDQLEQQILSLQPKKLFFNCKELSSWNSVLVVFVSEIRRIAKQNSLELDCEQLPQGVSRLIRLSEAVPENEEARFQDYHDSFFEKVGRESVKTLNAGHDLLEFFGRIIVVSGQFLRGCARYRAVDIFRNIQETGAQALPIISLIAFLMGLILAYVGAVQLTQFGAQIFVADLVAIAIVREMGPIMTAVVMAGRTGAAFAAQLGTMKVNQEIDAYQTMAISPYQFLVFPRLLALCLMMPLLCVFSNFIGIFGGAVVARYHLGISWLQYYTQVQSAIGVPDISLSLIKAFVFGVVVAAFGCYRGMRSGNNALAVGQAATSAVVSSLVLIVILDALFAIMTGVWGI
ncbi:MAG: ABC transporter permease [Bradymonadales bacterium]|nr:MAG: ABC transporter permease [Bradymonadales bacterium]